jgi:hypothetical protein
MCVAPGVTNPSVRSRVIAESSEANSGVPPPISTGTTCTTISSTSPNGSACCMIVAPCSPTTFSPATSLACFSALSTPSVTNV